MKPLILHKRILLSMGTCSSNGDKTRENVFALIKISLCATFVINCILYPCITHFVNNFSQITDALGSGTVIIAGLFAFVSLLSFGIRRNAIGSLLEQLKSLVNKRFDNLNMNISPFELAERKSQTYTRRVFKTLAYIFVLVYMISIIAVFFSWLNNVSPEEWQLPVKAIVLLEQTTPVRYLINLCYNFVCVLLVDGIWATTGLFFMSLCLYIYAMMKHLCNIVKGFDLLLPMKGSSQMEGKNIEKLEKDICNAISYHVELLKFVENAIEIMNEISFTQPFICVASFVSSIYMVEMNFFQYNSDTLVGLFGTFLTTLILYFHCYFAETVTVKCQLLAKVVYELQWYRYPPRLRKYLLIIILQSQKPIYFHGFKIVQCSMPTFASMMKSAISYYLIVRRLYV